MGIESKNNENEADKEEKFTFKQMFKYMKYFYEMYHISNRQQVVDDFIFMIPWGHIVLLLNKFQNDKNQLYFYSRKINEM